MTSPLEYCHAEALEAAQTHTRIAAWKPKAEHRVRTVIEAYETCTPHQYAVIVAGRRFTQKALGKVSSDGRAHGSPRPVRLPQSSEGLDYASLAFILDGVMAEYRAAVMVDGDIMPDPNGWRGVRLQLDGTRYVLLGELYGLLDAGGSNIGTIIHEKRQ